MCNLLKSQVLKTRTGTKHLRIPVYFTFFLSVTAFEKLTCLWDQKKTDPFCWDSFIWRRATKKVTL